MPIDPELGILGGGAAGMMAAAVWAEAAPGRPAAVFEKGAEPMAKLRRTGGGRCNLTRADPDPRRFAGHYPRGGPELLGLLRRFGPAETMAWFEARGLPLAVEPDGRVFPRSNRAGDVARVLARAAARGRVEIRTRSEVAAARPVPGGFELRLAGGGRAFCRRVLVATGGGSFPDGLDHTIEPCVPSLFPFRCPDPEWTALAGVSAGPVRVSAAGHSAEGDVLATHQGVSGPAVLALSSLAARELARRGHRFELAIHWWPAAAPGLLPGRLAEAAAGFPRKRIGSRPPLPLPARLWALIVARSGADPSRPWGRASRETLRRLAGSLAGFTLPVAGRAPARGEFVTCGGIRLAEVAFRPGRGAPGRGAMESLRHPGLFFAGEALDLDGLTGGYNLQAAWTTGALAARALLRA